MPLFHVCVQSESILSRTERRTAFRSSKYNGNRIAKAVIAFTVGSYRLILNTKLDILSEEIP